MKLEIIENKDDYTSIKIPDNCEVTVKDGLINIEKSIQDGDFVFIETYYCNVIAIFKSHRDDKSIYYHSCICYPKESCSIAYNDWCAVKKIRKATEEEKGILTNALMEENKYWDASSKSIKIIPEKNKFYTITNKSDTINKIFISKSFDLSSTPVCLSAYASYSVDIYTFDVGYEEVLIDEDTDVIVCTSLLSTSFFSEYTIKEADPLEIRTFLSAMSKKGYTWDFKNEKIVKINHFWQPSIGERYYYIGSSLNSLIESTYSDSKFERILQKNGGCFKTKEAAENCLEEIKKIYKKINTI